MTPAAYREIRPDTPGWLGSGSPHPIEIPGQLPAVLALHGFGSTPRELDPIADVASELGHRVRAPLLPGHGTHPRDLATTRFLDWYGCAERELLALSQERPVVLIGLSMGAVLAMKLASEHPRRVRALGLLANAITMAAYPSWPLLLLNWMRAPDFTVEKSKGPDIADPTARARHLTYRLQPVRAAADLQRAAFRVERGLGRIRCPVFLAHGLFDHVCPVSNVWRVANRVSTNVVEIVTLPRSCHIITKDLDAELLLWRVRGFLERHAPVEP